MRRLRSAEISEVVNFTGLRNPCYPKLMLSSLPSDSLEPRRVRRSQTSIAAILRPSRNSKILLAVIKRIPVSMIPIHSLRSWNQLAMHVYDFPLRPRGISANRIEFSRFSLGCTPGMERKVLIIFGVDHRDLALSQPYQTNRSIFGLLNTGANCLRSSQ